LLLLTYEEKVYVVSYNLSTIFDMRSPKFTAFRLDVYVEKSAYTDLGSSALSPKATTTVICRPPYEWTLIAAVLQSDAGGEITRQFSRVMLPEW